MYAPPAGFHADPTSRMYNLHRSSRWSTSTDEWLLYVSQKHTRAPWMNVYSHALLAINHPPLFKGPCDSRAAKCACKHSEAATLPCCIQIRRCRRHRCLRCGDMRMWHGSGGSSSHVILCNRTPHLAQAHCTCIPYGYINVIRNWSLKK